MKFNVKIVGSWSTVLTSPCTGTHLSALPKLLEIQGFLKLCQQLNDYSFVRRGIVVSSCFVEFTKLLLFINNWLIRSQSKNIQIGSMPFLHEIST